jgi:E3 ubiquitin-protein ligase DOA10
MPVRLVKDRLYEKTEVMNSTGHPLDSAAVAMRKVCRICLDEDGVFVAPCACSGSMRHVHYQCLEEWLLRSFTPKVSYAEFKKSKC